MEDPPDDGGFVLAGDAHERFYESSGIGRPTGAGGVLLSWEEAVYLLERGDVDDVDGATFDALVANPPDPRAVDRWVVYRDLRERGYYVATAYSPGEPPPDGRVAFHTRPRGAEPTSDTVADRVMVVSESTRLRPAALDGGIIAIADDEAEVTYIEVREFEPTGEATWPRWGPPRGYLSGKRVNVPDPPEELFGEGFFGTPLAGASGTVSLNLLEAGYLLEEGLLEVPPDTGALEAVVAAESGAAFERRSAVYRTLREAGCVPRSGLKFGADFRVYTALADATEPGHSSLLVEVVPRDAWATPGGLSRAVRLATGVRKRHVVAAVDDASITWLALDRHRP